MNNKTFDLINSLEKKFKLEFVKAIGGYKLTFCGSPMLMTDGGKNAIDGLSLFDFYNESDTYVGGIHKELNLEIENQGFIADWYDTHIISFSKI